MEHRSTQSGFAQRLAHLRELLHSDAAEAGDQGLKLLEEYLEVTAQNNGYRDDHGSINRYALWLRRRGPIPRDLLEQAETYNQIRNCLAHSYGLQTSPQLAREIIDYLSLLILPRASRAFELMSRNIQLINADDQLRHARDLMLRAKFGRLPVLKDGKVIGLLTERDIVAAEAAVENGNGDGRISMTVEEAMPIEARKRFRCISEGAALQELTAALRHSNVEALIVTPDGRPDQQPVGIITANDLLYRL
jgi:predicted transcriptional regulator